MTGWVGLDGTVSRPIGPPAWVPAYRITTDGASVYARDSIGSIVSSGTDAGAVLSAILPATGSLGADIAFGDGSFPWSTVPVLPSGITGGLRIRGSRGTKIVLSASAPRFLDPNRVVDYDIFLHLGIVDLLIDANNIGGKHHVVFGTYANGVNL